MRPYCSRQVSSITQLFIHLNLANRTSYYICTVPFNHCHACCLRSNYFKSDCLERKQFLVNAYIFIQRDYKIFYHANNSKFIVFMQPRWNQEAYFNLQILQSEAGCLKRYSQLLIIASERISQSQSRISEATAI